MAADGRSKTLDATADGYVRSEACLLLYLHHVPDSDAAAPRAAGTPTPWAWLQACAVNQDGRSSSLTAPHGPSQRAVLSAAHGALGSDALPLQSLEAHGTGTALGDPIEVGAVRAALQGAWFLFVVWFGGGERAARGQRRRKERGRGRGRLCGLALCSMISTPLRRGRSDRLADSVPGGCLLIALR